LEKIMLVISTMRHSSKAVEYAFQSATERKAELASLFILDSNVPSSVFQRLHEMDLIGEKPSEELSEALHKEYRQRGYTTLKEIEKKAKEGNIPCTIYLEEGDFAEEVFKKIDKLNISLVILSRIHRSNIARLIFGSAVDRIIKQAKCEVKIVDE